MLHSKKMGLLVILLGVMTLTLSGCARKGNFDSESYYGIYVSPSKEKKLLAQKVYHFGFDRYDLSNEDVLSVYAHARKINCSDRIYVRIEGHTDERGSRNYNIALGEKRAKSIYNILILKGVDPNKLRVVSYGKEKPIKFGHDEASWAMNRRAVIVYEK